MESDRYDIARCIAEGFEKDFSVLCKNPDKVAAAIANGLNLATFYVAETNGAVTGVMAISDCNGRAASVDNISLKKHLGLIKGWIGAMVLKEEFEGSLEYPETTGYIEFVTVRKDFRGKGIASLMLKESMTTSKYREFILDVTDVNTNALGCYQRLGFREFRRVEEKHAKQKGFGAKIYMRYSPNNENT